jgi:hypothetical protein
MEFIIIPIFAAVIGACVASAKGRAAFGWGFICLVFPIALLILLCLPSIKPHQTVMQQVVYVQVPAGTTLPQAGEVLPQIEARPVTVPVVAQPRRGGFFS